MNGKNYLKSLVLCCLGLALSCGQALSATTISMVGTDDAEELMEDLAEGFMEDHPGIKVDLGEGEGSGQGIRSAGMDEVDFGITARAIKSNEAAYNLKQAEFAKIPVVFVAHPSVGLRNLTVAQTRDLFSGRITNWSQINGSDTPVRLVRRHEGESVQEAIRENLAGWADLKLSAKSKMLSDEDEVLDLIAEKKGAIGFAVIGEVEEAGLKPLTLDGLAPGDEKYPVHTPLGLVYKESRLNEAMREFLDYVFSNEAKAILAKYKVVPTRR